MTVRPETTIARPTVAAAASSAACGAAPGAALLALAADVEQRVVDADGQADEHDQRCGRVVHRRDLGDDAQRAHRRDDRGDAEQQRHATRPRARRRRATRMISVIGSEISSARLRSCVDEVVDAPCRASPAPASLQADAPGAAARTAATARCSGATWSPASSGSPRSVAWTSTVRPPARRERGRVGRAADGARPAAGRGRGARARVRRRRWSKDRAERTSTLSTAGSRRPARSRRASARADSPTPESVRRWVPVIAPAATQPTTSASQRAMTVLGRRAEAPAARRTRRARRSLEVMRARSQRAARASLGRGAVRAPGRPRPPGWGKPHDAALSSPWGGSARSRRAGRRRSPAGCRACRARAGSAGRTSAGTRARRSRCPGRCSAAR